MMKQKVSVVITDFDNTLYDQFKVWHQSFVAMLDQLAIDSGIDKEILKKEIKEVHTKHKTSEYAFLIQELPSLRSKHPSDDLAEKYAKAISAYRKERDATLRLYPRVAETLATIKEHGSIVICYTEAQYFYAEYKLRELGLDRIVDYLYSSPDHDMPAALPPNEASFYPSHYRKLEYTIHRSTPAGVEKPDPQVLLSIINTIGAAKDEVIYIGDKKSKDVKMAQAAQVTDIHAAYGVASTSANYDLLREVTYWTTEQVNKERDESEIIPQISLQNSYSEILALFKFVPFTGTKEKVPESMLPHYLETWKKTIDVQMHFNDLELRIRNFAITVLAALLTGAALTLKENIMVTLLGYSLPVAGLLLLAALVTWLAFYSMDRIWYHRLLLGAVSHGVEIENRLAPTLSTISLTNTIGTPKNGAGLSEKGSSVKMHMFYLIIAFALLVLAWLLIQGQSKKLPAASNNSNSVTEPKKENSPASDNKAAGSNTNLALPTAVPSNKNSAKSTNEQKQK